MVLNLPRQDYRVESRLDGERNQLSGDFSSSEWAGPCYSPDGQWLFANIYEPGIPVAITGPWQSGAL